MLFLDFIWDYHSSMNIRYHIDVRSSTVTGRDQTLVICQWGNPDIEFLRSLEASLGTPNLGPDVSVAVL